MTKVATLERKLALPVIGSCRACHWFKPCGGYRDTASLFGDTCFERHCCEGKADCNYLCPSNPRFSQMMNEVQGLRFDRLPPVVQRRVSLPEYVPSILHHSRRGRPLTVPIAAIPVEQVLQVKGKHMRAVATDPASLRAKLCLDADTRIVLNCVRKDDPIERLWEYWVQDDVPGQLSGLDIDLVIAPNFSHLQGVVRLESIGNRMRQLMCVRDMVAAGLNTVPHLSVLDPHDWDFWREWLARNPKVKRVAFEFETGYKQVADGIDAIGRMAAVQRAIDRELHLIVVGGTQYHSEVTAAFRKHTFIDASPFYNTVMRQRARLAAGQLAWSENPTEPAELLDDLLENNLGVYGEWMCRLLSCHQ